MTGRLSIAIVLVGLVAGCRAEGQASIFSSVDARQKAAIGFLVDCKVNDDGGAELVAAAIRYDDPARQHHDWSASSSGRRAAAVRIRGRVEHASVSGVDGVCVVDPAVLRPMSEIVIEGSYWPVSETPGDEGRFEITIENSGAVGTAGAQFRIELTGGAFDGHVNQGVMNDARITYIDDQVHVP